MIAADAVAALAEAMHDCDDTCNAHHYMRIEECATRDWDEAHAAEVARALSSLGWVIVRDPGGTVPMFPEPALLDAARALVDWWDRPPVARSARMADRLVRDLADALDRLGEP